MKALGGFQAFCVNENNDTNRAQFRMAYEALSKKQMMDAKTPQKLKDLMDGMGKPILKLVEPLSAKQIASLDVVDEENGESIEDIDKRSDNIRKLLAKAVRIRRKERGA